MKKRPFYFEIKNLIIQFMAAFNDVAIKRYNADRQTDGKDIGVGFMPLDRGLSKILSIRANKYLYQLYLLVLLV